MVPSWMIKALIISLGCIVAVFLGATLPDYNYLGAYLLGIAIVGAYRAITNNFPALWRLEYGFHCLLLSPCSAAFRLLPSS